MNALATPDSTATISRPSSTPPPISLIASRSVVPIGISATAARRVAPLTVHTSVPGDCSVPYARNASTPSARIRGTFASVSQLFASVGGAIALTAGLGQFEVGRGLGAVADLVHAVAPRRGDARERFPAVEHLEQAGLLAVEVGVRAAVRDDLEVVEPPRDAQLFDRLDDARHPARERLLHGDDHLLGVHRVRGDQRAFEHLVGVRAQQRAVLERARLALGRVDHHRGRVHGGLVRGDGLPLAPGREPGTTAAAQSRGEHRLDRLRGRRAACDLQPPPAAQGEVGLERHNRTRVEDAMHRNSKFLGAL